MEQLDVFQKMGEIGLAPTSASEIRALTEHERMIQRHRTWLRDLKDGSIQGIYPCLEPLSRCQYRNQQESIWDD